MNDVLGLKGRFQPKPGSFGGGGASLPKGKDEETGLSPRVDVSRLKKHAASMDELRKQWGGEQYINGVLVDVHYKKIIAKSNRVRAIFETQVKGKKDSNNSVVGARFSEDGEKHIITHYVTDPLLADASGKFMEAAKIVEEEFGGAVSPEDLQKINEKVIDFNNYSISKSTFAQIVVDGYYASNFSYPDRKVEPEESIITLYKTDNDVKDVLKGLGIAVSERRVFGDSTVQLDKGQIDTLFKKAPYLIAMSVEDFNTLVQNDEGEVIERSWMATIPTPGNEPVVGVIDTPFETNVGSRPYFYKWVDYRSLLDPSIGISSEDTRHGTAVSSIIVDGPSINPNLEDGCGRFRVRHFGVALKGNMSSFQIMRDIEDIVKSNRDIKVWNLSLGSVREIATSYISPEAAMLDALQTKYDDTIFIVSGTNNNAGVNPGEKLIGSPADSINSIVVNAVDDKGNPPKYSRKGEVLSFFKKPDVASFGGDSVKAMEVCSSLGTELMTGTSFAAPWITRKAAFMIEVLGLSREVTKALLLDSATGWDDIGNDSEKAKLLGHGIVPRHINDIVKTPDDEIKFYINIESTEYDTYSYNLPVPVDGGKHPFVAKATLCYFPICNINQGVDYTSTELDVYIGRIKKNGKTAGLKPIDKNIQSLEEKGSYRVDEKTARRVFRKWDNAKHIREVINDKYVPRKAYEEGLWGISVKRKNRTKSAGDAKVRFGLVVTLKEMYGVNRINDFIQRCSVYGWLVSEINIDNSLDIYIKSQETVEL